MSGPNRLAVYGTLAPGGANAHVLEDVPGDWATGTVSGSRHDDGWHGYPGLVLDATDDADEIPVHVLEAPGLSDDLERLDAFEGPGYRRVVASVQLADGRRVRAWVYVLVEPPT